jgi:hypothetical protein
MTRVAALADDDVAAPTAHGFVLGTSGGRTDYLFAAESAGERQAWLAALGRGLAQPVRAGYLSKRGAHNPAWKRRYFVLRGRELAYYDAPSDRAPKGTVDPILDAGMATDETEPHCFFVATVDRRFQLRAASEHEMDAWLRAIDPVLPAGAAVGAAAAGSGGSGSFPAHSDDDDSDDDDDDAFVKSAGAPLRARAPREPATDFARQTALEAESPDRGAAGRHSVSWSNRRSRHGSTVRAPSSWRSK